MANQNTNPSSYPCKRMQVSEVGARQNWNNYMNCGVHIYPLTPLSPAFLHACSATATQCQPTLTWVKVHHCSSADPPRRSHLLSCSDRRWSSPAQARTYGHVQDRPTGEQQHFHLLFADWGISQCIHFLDKILVRKIPSLLPFLKGVLNNLNVVAESLLSHTRPFWSMKNKFPQILGGTTHQL